MAIGSCGWGTGMPESLSALLPNRKVAWLEAVNTGGTPKPDDFAALDRLADDIRAVNLGQEIVISGS